MKVWFFELLKKADLYYQFINTYGNGNEEACCAEYNHLEGWFFDEDTISYREEDLFDSYEEGYNWEFVDDILEWAIKTILLTHDFEVEYEGGDEEDGLFVMKKI